MLRRLVGSRPRVGSSGSDPAVATARSSRRARAADAVVWAALSLAALSSIAPAVLALTGLRTMVVTGGSMAPAIHAGDAVLIARGAVPARGDVVTFPAVGDGQRTTHRVVGTKEIGGTLFLQTKGDANATPDPNLVPAAAVEGTVRRVVPWIGRPLYYLAVSWGRVLLIGIPAMILLVRQLRSLRIDDPALDLAPSGRAAAVLAAAVFLFAVGLAAASYPVSDATFTDTISVGGNTFTTAATW